MKRPRAIVAAAMGAVALVALAVPALALWLSSATGSGNARALTATTISVTATTGAADLYPGFTQGKVFFTAANTNPYNVTLTSLTSGTVTSSDQTNCPASNVTVANASGLSLLVPAGATAQAGSVANVVTMAPTAPDGCQGVTFTIGLTFTGTQS